MPVIAASTVFTPAPAAPAGTDLTVTSTATNVTVVSSTGTDAVLPTATATVAGVMSAAAMAKLNSIVASRGSFSTLAALVTAHPAGVAGDNAILTHGVGVPATVAIWDTDNTPPAWVDTGSAPVALTGTTGRLARFGGTTTGPLAASTGIFEDANGKIGIGTTTPAYELEVKSSVNTPIVGFNSGALGSGVAGIYSGTGPGHGVVGGNIGSGTGNGMEGNHSGTGPGHGAVASVTGGGNGHGLYAHVGGTAAATGTGFAVHAVAFDTPANGSHLYALVATVNVATGYAGIFNGNLHATGTSTSSDRRIKSDFKPVTLSDMDTIGRLPIQTYYKHLDGRTTDLVNETRIGDLRARIAAIKAMPEKTQALEDEIAAATLEVQKFDAEDWNATQGPRMPGRLAGVIAQDVEAVAPEYVTRPSKPFVNGPDLDPIRSINDSSILYIMVETLRSDIAKLAAEFEAYRATHP